MIRLEKLRTWLIAASIALPLPIAAAEDEASLWLQKMGTALREQNYVGVFTYLRGAEFNTMRIAHRYEDGQVRERIFQLNGEQRDITRVDDEVICHHDGAHKVDLTHNVPLGPFTQIFSDNISHYREQYRFTMRGADRVANREAVMLDIMPRFDDRYGYRLWLDKETGLLLQSHLVDRKRVREQFQFAEIEIGGDVSDEVLTAAVNDETVKHQLTAEILDQPSKPALHVAWLPDGFRIVQATRNRLHFSDGLATFSVFVERAKPMPDVATRVGGTAVITRTLSGTGQITVVGEVPVATARRVAESVEPVIY